MNGKEAKKGGIRLKQLLSEHPTLTPTSKIVTELAKQDLQQIKLLQQAFVTRRYQLTDLTIANINTTEPLLAALAVDLACIEESAPEFIQQVEAVRNGLVINENVARPSISTNYLLLLGGDQTLGESLDFTQISSVFLSVKSYFASAVDAKIEEWQKLGFELEIVNENSLELSISHPKPSQAKWLYLLEWLINEIVSLGRPVDYYTTTFFLPLDLVKNDEVGHNWKYSTSDRLTSKLLTHVSPYKYKAKLFNQPDLDAEHEAWIYFSPHQRRYLFDEANAKQKYGNETVSPIREYRLIDPEASCYKALEWQLQLNDQDSIRVPIKQVTLYSYFNGMMCLAIQVEQRNELPDQHWVTSLLTGTEQNRATLKNIQYQRYLTFTKNARVLYPPYIAANAEGKHFAKALYQDGVELIADDPSRLQTIISDGDRFRASVLMSRPILYLLAEFFRKQPKSLRAENLTELTGFIDERLTYLPDDRMFVSCCYGLANDLPQQFELQQKIYSYALNVDDNSMTFNEFDDFCYHKPLVKKQLEEDVYQRWITNGTWSGYTDFSHAYLGTSWFFKNMIAPNHVKNIYNRMLLSALFYRTSFEHYNRRITTQTNRLVKKGCIKNFLAIFNPPFAKLRRDFILFVNQYWFVELTSQIQGREQLKMMLKPLAIEQQFEQIQAELHSADEYVGTNNGKVWGGVAVVVSVVSLLSLLEVMPQLTCLINYGLSWLFNDDLTPVIQQCNQLWPSFFGGK